MCGVRGGLGLQVGAIDRKEAKREGEKDTAASFGRLCGQDSRSRLDNVHIDVYICVCVCMYVLLSPFIAQSRPG